ncbi:solute carrier family 35 member F2-like [Gastrophryne carolinensis]
MDGMWKVDEKTVIWHFVKISLLGQVVSLCICGISVSSQLLVSYYGVDAPMLQNFLSFLSLALVYTVWLALRPGENGLLYILRNSWWKYFLVAMAEVEGSYFIVKAFQYTTFTSIQLLRCIGIPALMVLSWFILRAKYKLVHYVAVLLCLLGVGIMVYADVLSGRDNGQANNMLIGDTLVIVGVCLFAVSDVCQEYVVKNLGCLEFLGMLGLFGSFISGIQLMAVESTAISSIVWNWKIGLLFASYTVCLFCLYSALAYVIRNSSAISINLGVLTANIYTLFFSIFLFGYKFSSLYIVSLVIIMVGFIMYSGAMTYSPEHPEERRNQETGGGEDISEAPVVVLALEGGNTNMRPRKHGKAFEVQLALGQFKKAQIRAAPNHLPLATVFQDSAIPKKLSFHKTRKILGLQKSSSQHLLLVQLNEEPHVVAEGS